MQQNNVLTKKETAQEIKTMDKKPPSASHAAPDLNNYLI